MLHRFTLAGALLALTFVATAPALAGKSSLIRIEPRAHYGAVVTKHHGVRVWRPLPRTSHMIINPTKAPVHVNISQVRETVTHRGYPQIAASSYDAEPSYGGYTPAYGIPGYRGQDYGHGHHGVAGLPIGRAFDGFRGHRGTHHGPIMTRSIMSPKAYGPVKRPMARMSKR